MLRTDDKWLNKQNFEAFDEIPKFSDKLFNGGRKELLKITTSRASTRMYNKTENRRRKRETTAERMQ